MKRCTQAILRNAPGSKISDRHAFFSYEARREHGNDAFLFSVGRWRFLASCCPMGYWTQTHMSIIARGSRSSRGGIRPSRRSCADVPQSGARRRGLMSGTARRFAGFSPNATEVRRCGGPRARAAEQKTGKHDCKLIPRFKCPSTPLSRSQHAHAELRKRRAGSP